MNVEELITMLEGLPMDAEVRIAHQPEWPFEYSVDNVVEVEIHKHTEWDEEIGEEVPVGDSEPIVYIVDGRQIGYLPGEAKEHIGW